MSVNSQITEAKIVAENHDDIGSFVGCFSRVKCSKGDKKAASNNRVSGFLNEHGEETFSDPGGSIAHADDVEPERGLRVSVRSKCVVDRTLSGAVRSTELSLNQTRKRCPA